MSTIEQPRALADLSAPPQAVRPPGAVKAWAALGSVTLIIIAAGIGRWLFSDDFSSIDPGSDRYAHLTALRVTEVVSVVFLLYFLVSCVVLPLIRERAFSFDGRLLLACLCVHFIDPVFNYFSPSFVQNAWSVDMGSWANFIPGYASPSGDAGFVEGVLWAAALYGLFGVAAAKIGCQLLAVLRTRRPGIGNVSAYSWLFAVFAVGDFVIENFFVRMEIYIFWGAWSPLTLWAGELYQFPIYETVLAVTYALGFVWLRDSRDGNGNSWVERGRERLAIGRRLRTTVGFLALVGFSLMWGIASYFGPFSYFAMKSDAFPAPPSYLQGGVFCGTGELPQCPSEYVRQLKREYPSTSKAP